MAAAIILRPVSTVLVSNPFNMGGSISGPSYRCRKECGRLCGCWGLTFPLQDGPVAERRISWNWSGRNPKQVVGSDALEAGGRHGRDLYNNSRAIACPTQDFSQQFHVFSLIWAQDSLQFLVDNQVYVNGSSQNVSSGVYPFNSPFLFIFNVAVGGDWPGPPDNTTIFPQRMFVDNVRGVPEVILYVVF